MIEQLFDIESLKLISQYSIEYGILTEDGLKTVEVSILNTDETISNAVGRKETLLNTLQERICIDGITEVIEVICAGLRFGRGSHTNLRGTAEILQHLTPSGIIFCTATVTLINNDEVKEIRLDLRKRVGFVIFLVSDQLVV